MIGDNVSLIYCQFPKSRDEVAHTFVLRQRQENEIEITASSYSVDFGLTKIILLLWLVLGINFNAFLTQIVAFILKSNPVLEYKP